MTEPVRTRRTSEIGPVDRDPHVAGYADDVGRSRISGVSWSAIAAGTAVSLAVMLLINQIMVWAGFGLGNVVVPGNLSAYTTSTGLWISLSAFLGIFAGSYVAARAAASRTSTNGMWHGLAVWGTSVVLALILSTVGLAPLIGFGITPHSVVSYFGLTGTAGPAITGLTGAMSGWFLLQIAVGFVAGVGGGVLGIAGRAQGVQAVRTTEEYQERRAA